MEIKRDKLGRFVKGTIPPYANKPMPLEVKAKIRAKALTPERLETSIANLEPNGVNVSKLPDVREKIAEFHRGRRASMETSQKMSKTQKQRFQDPELRQRMSTRLKQVCKDPDVKRRKAEVSKGRVQSVSERAKKSEATTKVWQDAEIRTQMSSGIKEAYTRPEVKEKQKAGVHRRWESSDERHKQALLSKQLWQDPRYIRKVIQGTSRRPTKPERILDSLLTEHFPEFKYNGDFSLGITIGGMIPDFVNVNGKKQVIEVFGDYHHSPEFLGDKWQQTELGKIMLYNSLGWKCLVLWEYDIEALAQEELIDKIRYFFRKARWQHARKS